MAVNNLPFRDIRKVASMATTFFDIFDQTWSYRIFHLCKNQVDGFY